MPLTTGTTLGPYEVVAKIGAGGMGVVYRARDTKLDRDVALKVLPEAFTSDPDRLARFEREAKVLASLNHPNIGSIYGLEEQDGIRALVLELVEGPTLADRIRQGPIPLDEALPIAKQIAEALEAAHERGVIHRDLKPANVKVKDDGTVKVLDFGLAKAFQPDASDPGLSASPTISLTAAATQMGMVIGTAAYMAPEQASGRTVDKRADVWAFGVVMFEMLTGTRPFVGDDVSKTLAHVIATDPDWSVLPKDLAPVFARFIHGCLEKDPRQRVQAIGDVRLALEGAFETTVIPPSDPAAAPRLQVWQRPIPLAIVALVISAIAGSAVWALTRPQPIAPRVGRFAIPPPAPLTVGVSTARRDIAISPDGTRVVYTASGGNPYQLYVRGVDELSDTPLQIPNAQVLSPFVSPDSAWVGFFDNQGDILKKVSILGGPAVTICSVGANLHGASWGEDDTIVFGTNTPSGLWRVSSNGGEPEELTSRDEDQGGANHSWPHILPGGRAVLFTILTGGPIDNAQIALLDLDTGEQTVLVPGGSNPRYAPTGHIVYGVGGTLRAVRFDLDRLEITDANPVPVLDGVVTKGSGAADFDLASDGSLVYVAGQSTGGAGERTAVWVDRQGDELPLSLPARQHSGPRLSPDGTRLAVFITDSDNLDVWVSELARGTLSRLTTDAAADRSPLWTPNGERVVFSSDRDGSVGLWWVAADGTGETEHLMTIDGAQAINPYAWSADGNTLVFEYQEAETGRNIGTLSLEGERTWEPLLDTIADEFSPTISPDGGWIAYASNETGGNEIYAQRFPELGSKVAVSAGPGRHPVWSSDAILFSIPAGMAAVPVEPGSSLQVGRADVLFPNQYFGRNGLREYDVSPDGQRFLRLRADAPTTDANILPEAILVQNWFEELKRLVPTDQ